MTSTTTKTNDPSMELRKRAELLGLWGIVAQWEKVASEPWLSTVIAHEESERTRRSLERRLRNARLGPFKPMADFDWTWPKEIDRELVDELLSLQFVTEPANVIVVGENGVGKTMIAQNLAYQAILRGHSALFISVSELLNDLAAQDSGSALTRRLKHYCRPQLLVIDELGYLATSGEHADLLFEVVTRRYQRKPTIITTNKTFTDWGEVFPNASCIVALVDRLIHKAEVVRINAESYRLKEAQERTDKRKKSRTPRTAKSQTTK